MYVPLYYSSIKNSNVRIVNIEVHCMYVCDKIFNVVDLRTLKPFINAHWTFQLHMPCN